MEELKIILSYLLLSFIGLGIILLGVIFSNFGGEISSLLCFAAGIAVCIISFVAARKFINKEP